MKVLVQRVKEASVKVDEKVVGNIENGLMLLVGVTHGDTEENAEYLAKKVCNMRIFKDENEKMNLNVKDINGKFLVISQFTLYADCKKSGNRPSFSDAADREKADYLYEYFCSKCVENGVEVEKGIFGAHMEVSLINDGPVTIMLEG